MATHTIRIVVATTGAPGAVRQLNTVSTAAHRLGTSLGFLRGALAVGFAFGAVREFTQLADAFTKLQTRTRVFARSNAEAAVAQRELVDIAVRSRSSLDAVSELYQRMSQALGRVGASQGEVLAITETLTKAIAIGGATTAEAQGGLRQLSQAFAANRLSGQELNSVMEQLPVVAQLIADKMGVTVGELRQLGREGKITADVLRQAFGASADEIDAAFAKVQVTFGQAFEVIKTIAVEATGEILKAFDLEDLPKEIVKLALSFRELLKDKDKIREYAETIKAALFGVTVAVGALTAALVILNFNPIVASATILLTTIAYLSAELFKLRNVIFEIPGFDGVFTLSDIATQSWEYLVDLAKDFLTTLQAIIDLDFSRLGSKGIAERINNAIYCGLGKPQGGITPTPAARDLLTGQVQLNEFGGAGVAGPAIPTSAELRTQRILDRERARQNTLKENVVAEPALPPLPVPVLRDPAADKAREDALKAFNQLDARFSEGAKLGIKYAEDLKVVEEALKLGAVSSEDAAFATAELTKRFTEQARELDKSGDKLNAYRDSLEALEQQYDPEIAAMDEIADRQNTLNQLRMEATRIGDQEGLRRINRIEELAREKDALEEAVRIDPEATGLAAVNEGFKASLSELSGTLESEGQILKDGFSSIFSNIGDTFRNFFETGKVNFREFASSILGDIAGIMARMLALQALQGISGALGGSGGFLGAIGGAAGILAGGRAGGGDVMAGGRYMVGEAGPEQFVAPTDGRIVPAGGGSTTVHITVHAKDADSFRASKGQIESEMAGALARARQRNG